MLRNRSVPTDELRAVCQALHKSHKRRCEPSADKETQEAGAQQCIADGRPFESVDDALAPTRRGSRCLLQGQLDRTKLVLTVEFSKRHAEFLDSLLDFGQPVLHVDASSTEPPEACRASSPFLAFSNVARLA